MPKKRVSFNLSFELNGFDRGDPVKKAKRWFWAAVIGLATTVVSLLAHFVRNYDHFIGTPPPTQPDSITEVLP